MLAAILCNLSYGEIPAAPLPRRVYPTRDDEAVVVLMLVMHLLSTGAIR